MKTQYNYRYDKDGKAYNNLMTFEFSSDNDRAYKMFISSEDPVLNEPVKNPKTSYQQKEITCTI